MNEAGFFIFGETYSRGILEALLRVYWQNVMVPTEPASHAPYKPSQMPSGLQVRPEDRNHGRSNRKERHTVGLALLAGSGIGTSRGVGIGLSRGWSGPYGISPRLHGRGDLKATHPSDPYR